MFSLFRQKPKFKKEFYDKLLNGKPIEPIYGGTSSLTPNNEGCFGVNERDFIFYDRFKEFDRTFNEWHQEMAFRIQERNTTLVVRLSDDEPRYGRSYSIFYNDFKIGRLEIADSSLIEDSNCIFLIEIYGDLAQFIPYRNLWGFIASLGQLLVSSSEKEQSKFYFEAVHSLNASAWQMNEDGEVVRSDIEILYSSVPYYFEYRDQLS